MAQTQDQTRDQALSTNVRSRLQGTQFPASRADLERQATQNGAEEDVLLIIAVLPERSYATIDAVSEAVDQANALSPRPTVLSHALRGVHFPVRKADLARQAKGNGADENVMSIIQALPDTEYHTMAEVMKAYGELH